MLDKIDLHNGCPYKTGEGIFYYVADVKDNLYQLRTEVIAVLDSMKKDQPFSNDTYINKLQQILNKYTRT